MVRTGGREQFRPGFRRVWGCSEGDGRDGWLRDRIDRRTDAVVRADDPDALFVQHIPRKNWGVGMGENAADAGLLVLDYARKVVLYEGDGERWVVPAESVRSFKLESFTPPNGVEFLNRSTVAVLRVDVEGTTNRW